MRDISRVTVSLPTELLEEADQKLAKGEESRSALVRRLLEDALRRAREQENIERYIRGYREDPQTQDEFGWSDEAVRQGRPDVPWK